MDFSISDEEISRASVVYYSAVGRAPSFDDYVGYLKYNGWFKDWTTTRKLLDRLLKELEEKHIFSGRQVMSSRVGTIRDQFAIGSLSEEDAIKALTDEGKSPAQAARIVQTWRKEGRVYSSLTYTRDDEGNYERVSDTGNTEYHFLTEEEVRNELISFVSKRHPVTIDGVRVNNATEVGYDFETATVSL